MEFEIYSKENTYEKGKLEKITSTVLISNMTTKIIKLDDMADMTDFLEQFENETLVKPTASLLQEEINQTLHHLEESITCIQSCLEKPKTKRVNLNEINRKIDLILEILKQNTTS